MPGNSPTQPLTVPRTEAGVASLVADQPPGWEYLLFAARLLGEKDRIEPQYQTLISPPTPQPDLPHVTRSHVDRTISDVMSSMSTLVQQLEHQFNSATTSSAFGLPGQPGNPDAIAAEAYGIMDNYRQLIESGMRVHRLGNSFNPALRQLVDVLLAGLVSSVDTLRLWTRNFADTLETALASPDESIVITMKIVFEMPKGWAKQVKKARVAYYRTVPADFAPVAAPSYAGSQRRGMSPTAAFVLGAIVGKKVNRRRSNRPW
ncbi:MAG: hypothetical protein LBB54_04150 [Cellulomonadaceae bacterium]|jgi:hypothetical protein|nr:hypothetical protein [Cellulomonadaceae bacterium]